MLLTSTLSPVLKPESPWLRKVPPPARAKVSTSPEMLQHHYQFMARLNQAIELQEGVLANHQQRVNAARQVLMQAEFRLMSFKQVLASRQATALKARGRQEQKQMDELAGLQTQRQQRLQAENEA